MARPVPVSAVYRPSSSQIGITACRTFALARLFWLTLLANGASAEPADNIDRLHEA